jgi:Protein of unknown function (DUF3016)
MTFVQRIAPLAAFFVTWIGFAGPAWSATKPATATVDVNWTDPSQFSDTKTSPAGAGRLKPEEWLGDLAKHLKYRAARVLPAGDHLEVTFTDVQRAGRYEPGSGPRWDDVRIIKTIYPPSIDLRFTLKDADGKIVSEGTRKLRDQSFMQRSVANTTDPLRYEKRMLDDWVRKEFSKSGR